MSDPANFGLELMQIESKLWKRIDKRDLGTLSASQIRIDGISLSISTSHVAEVLSQVRRVIRVYPPFCVGAQISILARPSGKLIRKFTVSYPWTESDLKEVIDKLES